MNDWQWEMSAVSKLTPASVSTYEILAQNSNWAGEWGSWKLQRQLSSTINVSEDYLNPFQFICPEQEQVGRNELAILLFG